MDSRLVYLFSIFGIIITMSYFIIVFLSLVSLISACDFNLPNQSFSLNAHINASNNNKFAHLLRTKLNQNSKKTLSIDVGTEVHTQRIASYNQGIASVYYITCSIPVSVSKGNKQLLKTTLTKSIYINDTGRVLSNDLQYQHHYKQLRRKLLTSFIRQLKSITT